MRLAALAAVAALTLVPAVAASAGSSPVLPDGASRLHLPARVDARAVDDGHSTGCDLYRGLGAVCYTPDDLRAAYDFPGAPARVRGGRARHDATLDGSGQTIVLVDAYGSPRIRDDLNRFDRLMNIPSAPFDVVKAPGGGGVSGSGDVLDWSVETTLDVEYAHALAPAAQIVLVVAVSDDLADLFAAVAYAVQRYPGSIVSQSWGDDETDPTAQPLFVQAHAVYQAAAAAGTTVLASTGDLGATDCWDRATCAPATPVASYPASDPYVTAVGGTQGSPGSDGLLVNGAYGSEAVWNQPDPTFPGASGGAPSVLFDAPPWQAPLPPGGVTGRSVPDVAYDAAVNGGVAVLVTPSDPSFKQPIWALVGGTSAAAPQWASIFAIANETRAAQGNGPIGFANDDLDAIGQDPAAYARDLHDVTLGDNRLVYAGSLPQAGFAAGPGFDVPTGLGTPDVASLVADLATAPSSAVPGAPGPKPGRHGGHGGTHVAAPGR